MESLVNGDVDENDNKVENCRVSFNGLIRQKEKNHLNSGIVFSFNTADDNLEQLSVWGKEIAITLYALKVAGKNNENSDQLVMVFDKVHNEMLNKTGEYAITEENEKIRLKVVH